MAGATRICCQRESGISVDGTYMTRGHFSNIGILTVIGLKIGKVIDTGARSKLCKCCEYWEKQDQASERYQRWRACHREKCTLSHESLSGSKEGEIAKKVFSCSVELYNLRYTSFIGDGDTNSFKKVFLIQSLTVMSPCRNWNVSSRAEADGEETADGKSIGGRGRLTDMEINKIQAYYGNAIGENTNNLGMRSAD